MTAVLLAGGLSRRMGRDKAAIEIHGGPLWSRQLNLLRSLSPDRLVVSARARPAWCSPDVPVVIDVPPSRGPLSGIASTLQSISTTHLLVLAIDLPRMTGDVLEAMLSLASVESGVAPVIDNRFEPLCALYPAAAVSFANRALDSGDVSLQSICAALSNAGLLHEWKLSPAHLPSFHNVNTPAALAEC